MTLTEFILARVAEEQAEVLPPGISRIIDNGRILTMFPEVNRVLARCEAIRRIVEDRAGDDGEWWEQGPLVHLAAIWSDHPDYREEWSV